MIINWKSDEVPCEIKVYEYQGEIVIDYEFKGKYRDGGSRNLPVQRSGPKIAFGYRRNFI